MADRSLRLAWLYAWAGNHLYRVSMERRRIGITCFTEEMSSRDFKYPSMLAGCLLVLSAAACSSPPPQSDPEPSSVASPTSTSTPSWVAPAPESSWQFIMCVGESEAHPPGSTVRVDVRDGETVSETLFAMVPMQLIIPLPSGEAEVLVDGEPWMEGPAADDPLHAYGSGCPTTTPPR